MIQEYLPHHLISAARYVNAYQIDIKNKDGTNHILDNVLASFVKMRRMNSSKYTVSWAKMYLIFC